MAHLQQLKYQDSLVVGLIALLLSVWLPLAALAATKMTSERTTVKPISYTRDVRPIFQAHCLGCHQPAKKSGGVDLTLVESAEKSGESGQPTLVPGKAKESHHV